MSRTKKNLPTLNIPTGSEVNAGVEHHGGGTTMTGAGIDFYKLLTLRQGLGLQLRGIRITRNRSIPACSTIARKSLGLKGNTQSLYDQVSAMVAKIQKERAEQECGPCVMK